MTQLIAIGFWADHKDPSWPDPPEFTAPDLDQAKSRQAACYLDQGTVVHVWRGWSQCRICGYDRNGNSDLSNGTYLWPEGLAPTSASITSNSPRSSSLTSPPGSTRIAQRPGR
jgi:hypothetical protein